jgi:glycosyltransferase involved in cell wall biosynthesis
MKIVVVAACPFPAGRGSQLLIERMTQGLIQRGHEIEAVVPRFGDPDRPDPFPVRRAGLPQLGRAVDSRPGLTRALDAALLLIETLRTRPDVFLGHNVDGGLLSGLAARLLGVPSVYVRHGAFAEELGLMTRWRGLAQPLGGRAEQAAERLAVTVIELAPHPRARPVSRLEVIPPPADPDERRIEAGDGKTLYYEGNCDPYQNPSWLDAALAAARKVDPEVELLRASGPTQRPPRADLALVPRSLPGGFPMKLLAYQMAGVPAVCVESGAPGMVDGQDGFVVPGSGSPARFAQRVAEALREEAARKQLGERARERALARNDPERVSGLLEAALIRACMERGRRRPYIR